MDADANAAERGGWLQKLGLHRPELRAWAMYDWANSAMVTTIVAAVFPIYFQRVAAAQLDPSVATQRFAVATTISLILAALVSPLLGALADTAPIKKTLLGLFLVLGVLSTAGMFFIQTGDWPLALALFILADIGACGSFVFYDALLRHVARDDEMDRVSTTAYALGYLGGGLLLALNIAWIQRPDLFGLPSGDGLSDSDATLPTRLAFLSVSVWWLVFSLPLFLRVSEPAVEKTIARRGAIELTTSAMRKLRQTFQRLRDYKHALLMLAAFLIYNDGIGTIIRLATIYGSEIGLNSSAMIVAILVVQFVGVPCAILFGMLAGRIGTKRAIYAGLAVYLVITVFAYYLESETQFFLIAILVGIVQGGTQALSRSLFASMIPKREATEFFALFSLGEKFAGVLGPALFSGIALLTGSSRSGILSVVGFFVIGSYLLTLVDVEAGRQHAQRADSTV